MNAEKYKEKRVKMKYYGKLEDGYEIQQKSYH